MRHFGRKILIFVFNIEERAGNYEKNEVENKQVALDDASKEIERTFGKGSVMKLGERPRVDVDVIPSGSLLIDEALGVGGYPKGRIV